MDYVGDIKNDIIKLNKVIILIITMSTKEELIKVIRGWVKTDNEIKQLQNLLKEKKNEKKQQTVDLLEIMKTNEIECFDINNGKLMYTQTKVKQSVSKKLLLSTLSTYFQDDIEKAEELAKHILDSRGEKVTESIKRKENK